MTSQDRQPLHLSTSILMVLTVFLIIAPMPLLDCFGFGHPLRGGILIMSRFISRQYAAADKIFAYVVQFQFA
jgi:hypothetical protein